MSFLEYSDHTCEMAYSLTPKESVGILRGICKGLVERNKIIAVDFDGCLCVDSWPGIGDPNMELICFLKKFRSDGGNVILWTCRGGRHLKEALSFCQLYGLEFDEVNENLPTVIDHFEGNCRKIYADVYIDDKALRVVMEKEKEDENH